MRLFRAADLRSRSQCVFLSFPTSTNGDKQFNWNICYIGYPKFMILQNFSGGAEGCIKEVNAPPFGYRPASKHLRTSFTARRWLYFRALLHTVVLNSDINNFPEVRNPMNLLIRYKHFSFPFILEVKGAISSFRILGLFHFPFSWIYLTKGFLKKFCYWNLYFFHLGWGISEHFQKGRILCTQVSCCNSSPLAVTLMFVNVLSSGLCTCCAYMAM